MTSRNMGGLYNIILHKVSSLWKVGFTSLNLLHDVFEQTSNECQRSIVYVWMGMLCSYNISKELWNLIILVQHFKDPIFFKPPLFHLT
jgi:hypothetical protein